MRFTGLSVCALLFVGVGLGGCNVSENTQSITTKNQTTTGTSESITIHSGSDSNNGSGFGNGSSQNGVGNTGSNNGFGNGSGSSKKVVGSGKLKTESRPVANFHAINSSIVGDVIITQTGKEALKLSTDDNILPYLKTRIDNGTLYIEFAQHVSLQATQGIKIEVDVNTLSDIDIAGTADVQANQIAGDALNVTLSGTGNTKLSGHVTDLKWTLSGSGDLDATHLQAKSATIEISGTGNGIVNASDQLSIDISGTGNIKYLGSPKIQQSVSGTGSVSQQP